MADEQLTISLLGSVRVERGGVEIELGGVRRAGVLALLALAAPHAVGRNELVDGLWGDDSPESSTNAIQVHISALRRALGREAILTAGQGYRLADGIDVDVERFGRAVAVGRQQWEAGNAAVAAATLREALEMWRGPAFSGLDNAPFVSNERTRLEEHRFACLSARIEADLSLGKHQNLVAELQALVTQHPLREGLRHLLMQALYRSDRQAEALAVYDLGRRVLRDDLGAEPSPALQALHHRILTQTEQIPTAQALGTRRHLPALLDQTIGREADIRELEGLVQGANSRLVTLLGTGGVGKTRIAVEIGHRLESRFGDGAAFAPLADAKVGEDAAAIICSAMGASAGNDAEETLMELLQPRHMLLICDNFEHVLAAAPLLASLLSAAPSLHILATSRQPLRLPGEQQFRIEPLSSRRPGVGSSAAAELFLSKVRAREPRYRPDKDSSFDIEEICRLCDGLPLAIELAAARSQVLGVGDLRERLADPLQVLGSDTVDVPERHRTLRANLIWSTETLPEPAQRLLCQLTPFRGGFTLGGAAAAGGLDMLAVLPLLELLLDHSLVRRTEGSRGGNRFDLLETVRQFAAELLQEAEATEVHRHHAEFMRAVLAPGPEPRHRPTTAGAWNAVLPERANLRAAIEWSLQDSDVELAADLVVGATGLWDTTGPRDEMTRWNDMLLTRAISPGRRVDALHGKALMQLRQGEAAEARSTLAVAEKIAEDTGDSRRLTWVLALTSFSAWNEGNQPEAHELAERAASLATHHPDALVMQWATLNALAIAAAEGEASERHENALRFCREHHLDLLALTEMNNASERAAIQGDAERALELAEEGVALARRFDSYGFVADLLSQRGWARWLLRASSDARTDLNAALEGHLRDGSRLQALEDIVRIAATAADTQPEQAAEWLGMVDADAGTHSPTSQQVRARYLADLPNRLGDDYQFCYAQGQRALRSLGLAGAAKTVIAADPTKVQ